MIFSFKKIKKLCISIHFHSRSVPKELIDNYSGIFEKHSGEKTINKAAEEGDYIFYIKRRKI